MSSQLAFEHTKEYESLVNLGTFLGFLCGKPVYRKFEMRDVRPGVSNIMKLYGLNQSPRLVNV